MITPSLPEPVSDIRAQLDYMLSGYKDAVFIAAGNEDADPGESGEWQRHSRPEGTILTTSPQKLAAFRDARPLTDELMADILDYPIAKWAALRAGDFMVAQIRNSHGQVVKECLVSLGNGSAAAFIDNAVIPDGGSVLLESVFAAQARRALLRAA